VLLDPRETQSSMYNAAIPRLWIAVVLFYNPPWICMYKMKLPYTEPYPLSPYVALLSVDFRSNIPVHYRFPSRMMTDGDFYPSVHLVEAIILRFLHHRYRNKNGWTENERTNRKWQNCLFWNIWRQWMWLNLHRITRDPFSPILKELN